jgi:tellurite resistance protein TehA-like permease
MHINKKRGNKKALPVLETSAGRKAVDTAYASIDLWLFAFFFCCPVSGHYARRIQDTPPRLSPNPCLNLIPIAYVSVFIRAMHVPKMSNSYFYYVTGCS